MKTIYKTAIITVVALTMNLKTSVAQEPESRESIGKQLINNRIPGAKYGPEKKSNDAKETDKPKTYTKGNFKATLDEGRSQSGAPGAGRSSQKTVKNTARNIQQPLPSEKAAEKKEQPKIEVPKPPSQGDEKKAE